MTREEAVQTLATARGVLDADKLLASIEASATGHGADAVFVADPTEPGLSHFGIAIHHDADGTGFDYDVLVTDSWQQLHSFKLHHDRIAGNDDFDEEL